MTLPSHFHVLRAGVEAVTPISNGSGDVSPFQDVCLARDANGLPYLPSTGLTGVLRRATGDSVSYWGAARRGAEIASRVHVSDGVVHDAENAPVEGLCAFQRIADDPILAFLSLDAPILRDHVAINGRGAAADQQKFDRTLVPAGARFTFEVFLTGSEESAEADIAMLERIASVLRQGLRFGGATRRGLGKLKLVEHGAAIASWDRRTPGGRQAQAAYAASDLADRPEACGFQTVSSDTNADLENRVRAHIGLKLREDSFFRTGTGGADEVLQGIPISNRSQQIAANGAVEEAGAAQLSPHAEPWITYEADVGRVAGENADEQRVRFVIPGSSVKGALSHRTRFELHRLLGGLSSDPQRDVVDAAHRSLFGGAKRDPRPGAQDESEGLAGAVFIDDVVIELGLEELATRLCRIPHNSIDRFTQGVRDGLLFDEDALHGVRIDLDIAIDSDRPVDRKARQAFLKAIEALCQGRLALGAGDGDGMGRFEAEAWDREALLEWAEQSSVGAGEAIDA